MTVQRGDPILAGNNGRCATYVVAASDAPAHVKAQADYACDGAADDVEIQAAIDAAATKGGIVHLSEGSFVTAAAIAMKTSVVLKGVSKSYIPTATLGTYILPASDVKGVTVAAGVYSYGIRNLTINGNNLSGRGIEVIGAGASVLQNIGIIQTNAEGLYLASTWDTWIANISVEFTKHDGVFVAGTTNVLMEFVTAWGNAFHQIHVNADHRNLRLFSCRAGRFAENSGTNGICLQDTSDVTIDSAEIYLNNQNGILLSGAQRCKVVNCLIKDNDQTGGYDGIQLAASATPVNSTDNLIVGNTILSTGDTKHTYGIREADSNQDNNRILHNYISGVDTAPILHQGAGTLVKDNIGYVTENSGTATIANGQTSVTITHGLATTPTRVHVTPTLLSNAASFWVTDKGATTFVINVNADPGAGTATFDWKAQVGEG